MSASLPVSVRIAIIGTGFSGIGLAVRLRQAGIRDFVLLERSDDLGGTWRDNTYPGCRCDVPSHLYSFSFAPNPGWSRSFSGQAEIWDYLRGVVAEHDVGDHIRYGHTVTGADWDAECGCWQIATSEGSLSAQFLVSGAGLLSDPSVPTLPGIENFEGATFHSARWDHEHDLRAERIAVIGTGASAIQFVPEIQPLAGKLHVFQRTAPWVMPRRDRPITGAEKRLFGAVAAAQRAVRGAVYALRELSVVAFRRPRVMRLAELRGRRHLRRQVKDPALRERLRPQFTLGCKRILLSDDWYPALQKPNVEVVTDAVAEVRANSIVTADGEERAVDTIIYGTGFHVTDSPMGDIVRGRDGRSLTEAWAGSPKAYNGSAIAGFPNYFMLVGPNTGLGHTSVIYMIESQITYLLDALRHCERSGAATLEISSRAQEDYVRELDEQLEGSVWNAGGCRSWYLDSTGRNSTLWPGPTWRFRARLRSFDPEHYLIGEPAPAVAVAA